MQIEQIWTDNAARNFNYLIGCRQTGQAVALDPCAAQLCLQRAAQLGWRITYVVNTHEHGDHIQGNGAVRQASGARLLAPHNAGARISDVDQGLADGDWLRVGREIELQVLETPGHTLSHIALFGHDDRGPVLFSGDAVFNAGVGNCRNGGDPAVLYQTLVEKIFPMPPETRLYPGHDYLLNNLGFALDREPDNARAKELWEQCNQQHDPRQRLVTTLGLERQINPFFRLDSPSLQVRLRQSCPDLPDPPGAEHVFLALRSLRDQW